MLICLLVPIPILLVLIPILHPSTSHVPVPSRVLLQIIMRFILNLIATVLSWVALSQAVPTQMLRRDLLEPLPESVSEIELRFQPLLDFDQDGCYNTAAISPDGTINTGHPPTVQLQGGCRAPNRLMHSNVYSRARCNNGICAIMYVEIPYLKQKSKTEN